jgi:hypothetical protein
MEALYRKSGVAEFAEKIRGRGAVEGKNVRLNTPYPLRRWRFRL